MMLSSDEIETLLSLIHKAVHADGTWQQKRDAIQAEAGDQDESNLSEFAGWFAEE